jgi:acyl transferase domain-containing protein/acyl carrier protein
MTEAETDRQAPSRIAHALDAAAATIERHELEKREPIAIIGMACRFPGATTPEAFWKLLDSGDDAVTEIPSERWDIEELYDPDPKCPGKMYSRHGAFLEDVGGFDAPLFRISPREAESMDPQQRILLEATWEALERAGTSPLSLEGSATSVHVGVTTHDYSQLLIAASQTNPLGTYFTTGNAGNALAGRLSYFLGLRGPSMVVDTACSSSLVATHLACQSLRNRESNLAITGGVNLVLAQELQAALCRANMLSPSGRCRTFSADADGYVRGEGCGVIIMKRLSDAQRDLDPILAVIRGSAVNQDGSSSGFTVPHGPSQQALIRRALEAAQVDARDVRYLEAHGTGTPLGDPIEVNAASAVYGKDRDQNRPLIIGSVKTNVGHLEAAAGVAGLIKVVLSLQAQKIPAHLHFSKPNPHVQWTDLPIQIPTQSLEWTDDGVPRIAAISSFGASGTNAHAILEEAPQHTAADNDQAPEAKHVLLLSADTAPALRDLAAQYDAFLVKNPTVPLADVCYTAAVCRAHLTHRHAVTGSSNRALQQNLSLLLQGRTGPGIYTGNVRNTPPTGAQAPVAGMSPSDIATIYVEGGALPQDMYPRRRPIALPTYPFQHRTYWAAVAESVARRQPPLDRLDTATVEYETIWEPAASKAADLDDTPCHWLIINGAAAPNRIVERLEEQGHSCIVVDGLMDRPPAAFHDSILDALCQAVDHRPRRILYFAELEPSAVVTDADTLIHQASRACLELIGQVHCASELPQSSDTRIWIITRGLQQESSLVSLPHQLALSALWALGRTVATEYPEFFGGLIDLPADVDEAPELVLSLLNRGPDQLALRGHEAFTPKLRPVIVKSIPTSTPNIRADATYLVTGGLGGLGLHTARWLADHGAKSLVLVSRRGETPESALRLESLRARGIHVWSPRVNVADLNEMDTLLAELRSDWPPLRGIFHLAGVLDDRVVARLNAEALAAVFSPKIAGAWNLHLLTKDLELDHFVLFSSLASLVGSAGQGNYAAANAALDSLAGCRHAEGLPAIALNWGPWMGTGMADSLAAQHQQRLTRSGIRPLDLDIGFEALERAISAGAPQVMVANVDWERLFAAGRPRFLHEWASHLAGTTQEDNESSVAPSTGIVLEGGPRPLSERLTQFIAALLAEVLMLDPSEIEHDRGLEEYGMDSLTATELKTRVASRLTVDLPLGHLLGRVTVIDLVELVQAHMSGDSRPNEPLMDEQDSETIEVLI